MTPKERAAMQQALEALESCNVGNWSMAFDEFAVVEAITALREALAEPDIEEMTLTQIAAKHEQAANKSVERHVENVYERGDKYFAWIGDNYVQIYTAPVRTKDLTDDEIMKINVDTASIVPTCDRQFHFARAVIAADREKNK